MCATFSQLSVEPQVSHAHQHDEMAWRTEAFIRDIDSNVSLTFALSPATIVVMVTKKSVIISDDLDGSGNAKTVTFGLNGAAYEIDLAPKNLAKLETALAPYIDAGRRIPARSRRTITRHANGHDNAAIRAWAKSSGLQVADRGRISSDIIGQYEAGH
jgi:hypothetical protein